MDAPSLCWRQQYSSGHVQIDQAAGDEQAIRILVNAAVTHFAEAEDALQHQQRMLAPGAGFRLGPVLRTRFGTQGLVSMTLPVREVLCVRRRHGEVIFELGDNLVAYSLFRDPIRKYG